MRPRLIELRLILPLFPISTNFETLISFFKVKALKTYLEDVSAGKNPNVAAFNASVESMTPGSVKMINNAHVTELIYSSDRVTGVKYLHENKEIELHGDAIILTTGGYRRISHGIEFLTRTGQS
jgi:hypothetical protein